MKHNPRMCNAFHSACENVRDAGLMGSYTLAELDAAADLYVEEGLCTCTCPDRKVQP